MPQIEVCGMRKLHGRQVEKLFARGCAGKYNCSERTISSSSSVLILFVRIQIQQAHVNTYIRLHNLRT